MVIERIRPENRASLFREVDAGNVDAFGRAQLHVARGLDLQPCSGAEYDGDGGQSLQLLAAKLHGAHGERPRDAFLSPRLQKHVPEPLGQVRVRSSRVQDAAGSHVEQVGGRAAEAPLPDEDFLDAYDEELIDSAEPRGQKGRETNGQAPRVQRGVLPADSEEATGLVEADAEGVPLDDALVLELRDQRLLRHREAHDAVLHLRREQLGLARLAAKNEVNGHHLAPGHGVPDLRGVKVNVQPQLVARLLGHPAGALGVVLAQGAHLAAAPAAGAVVTFPTSKSVQRLRARPVEVRVRVRPAADAAIAGESRVVGARIQDDAGALRRRADVHVHVVRTLAHMQWHRRPRRAAQAPAPSVRPDELELLVPWRRLARIAMDGKPYDWRRANKVQK
mmetsp:Transcript_2203/g.9542  ORF Transcript_2203/g.9542 Transcript_2203/m.9542 type:complete len:392 (+) Transcript_2203:2524-3699(+)